MENKLPEGWEWKKLGEIAQINPKFDRKSISEDTEVTFLPMKCIEELTGNVDTSIVKDIKEVSKGYTPLIENDLLYAKITPCMENGKVAIAKGLKNNIGFASTEFHVVRFKKNAYNKFFFFYLIQKRIRECAAMNMTGSAGQKRVPATFLKDLLVPLPPLETQQKIVSILEKAEETKKLRSQADELTQKLLQSVFLEMFGDFSINLNGYSNESIESICTKVTDGEHNTPSKTENGVLLLMAKNVKDGALDLADVSYISEKDHEKCFKRCNPEKGDILLVCVGATIGRVAIVPETDKFSLVRSVALLKPNYERIISEYFLWCLKTDFVQSKLLSRRNTSAQAGLYLNELKKIELPIPPIDLQKKFSELVLKVEEIKSKQNMQSQEINSLFDALMQKAFRGELVT